MFGNIRPLPPSSAELLELERLPSKLFKDDSLSIYESTLVKLKHGCQRKLAPASQDSMDFESSLNALEDLSKVSQLSSEQGLRACSSGGSGMGVSPSPDQEHKRGRDVSIHYLFSKYASSHRKEGNTSYNSLSSVNVPACSSDSESTGCSQ